MSKTSRSGVYPTDVPVARGAQFSPCRMWRYQLWRVWNESEKYLNVIGLNPSTATETEDDPTIRRCVGFAVKWGFGGLYMTNIFAFRATLPVDMKAASDPVGPENDHWLQQTASGAGLVIAAWGIHGAHLRRDEAVCALIPELHCFKRTEKTGAPAHPLYLRADIQPVKWRE